MSTTMPYLEVESYPAGAFSWIEYVTPDLAQATDFYTALFGWTHDIVELGGGRQYARFYIDGKIVAGMTTEPPAPVQPPPFWHSFLAVDSVDQTVAAAKKAGGKVLAEPSDVMKLGRTAVIQDPTGGLVSLWQAGTRKGLDYAGGPGVASWRELLTDDVRTATAFYRTVFGWTGEVAESNGWVFAGLNNQEQPVAVIVTPPPALANAKPFWAVYFGVHDVNTTAAKVQELGGRALIEPTEYAGVPYALLRDPLGAVFFISGMPAA